ncbi:V-type ATPase subunit [Candidatus Gracilibacteria bacterium]|nr:V-type ATPase subunit [Candidatus Gracilibacteria bacterium]MCF7819269.1 V-type ATPase subunit [Candidatus Gracilibacteria bacterium]
MSSFLFINGQIRAMESRLLDVNRCDRMIGARSPEEAFRVLVELQYAEYVDEKATPQDFSRIIDQGLQETKDLLLRGTDNHPGFQFLWWRADTNNLKRALKLKLVQKKSELPEFTNENGFSPLGEISPEDLQMIVFEGKFPENFPSEYRGIIEKIPSLYEEKQEFRSVEFALDQAYFAILQKIARREASSFLKNWLQLQIDMVNARSLARLLLMREEKIPQEAFLEGGSYTWEKIRKIENWEQFLEFIKYTDFSNIRSVIKENDSDEDKLLKVEKECDRVYKSFLHQAQEGEIDSIQVPLAYFEKRLQNARMLKFIMFAKFHGLKPETIYQTLKQF